MPVFRTRPTTSIGSSIRRFMSARNGANNPLLEMQADAAAAQTAHRLSLVDKVRAEVDAMRGAEAARNDPNVATEFAAHSAGIDLPDATRLAKAIRGTRERPSDTGGVDFDDEGNAMPDVTYAKPDNLPTGSERVFRSALASTIANRIGTGKTNAAQLAQAGDRINETALTNEAANTADVPAANRIIAAVSGKLREPFKLGAKGQVLNEETGDLNEDTTVTGAEVGLTKGKTATERARQGELGARARLHGERAATEESERTRLAAAARLSGARADAVARGETGRGGQRVTPQQVERWVSEVARKEWDTIPAKDRKGMNYQQHLDKVRERFKATAGGAGAKDEVESAHAAIAKGADPVKVAKRFRERMGFDMPKYEKDDEE